MDIEIATTKELIDELINRQTFVGVVISSDDVHRTDSQKHQKFTVKTSLDTENLLKLIDQIDYQMKFGTSHDL